METTIASIFRVPKPRPLPVGCGLGKPWPKSPGGTAILYVSLAANSLHKKL
jgi:hypothetical protein